MHPPRKALVDFFTRSLAASHSSQDPFTVLCTLPHHGDVPAPRRATTAGGVKSLIVLDSSFNPPTTAHAQMARSAVEACTRKFDINAGEVRLMLLLAVNNADKAPKPAGFAVRLGMMERFGRGLLKELRTGGGSGGMEIDLAVTTMAFFHDKARAIEQSGFYRADAGNAESGQPEQTILAGFDTLVRIFNPKYYTAPASEASTQTKTAMQAALGPFFERARLRVTMRPDDEWGGAAEQEEYIRQLEDGELAGVGGEAWWAKERVEVVEGTGNTVSSSRARKLVKNGETGLGELVDDEVGAWIVEEGVYRDEE